MPNRKFQRIDFTDPARHGGHVGNYVDGEKVGFLTFRQHANRNSSFASVADDGYGVTALHMPSPLTKTSYWACCNFSSPILPDEWYIETHAGFYLVSGEINWCSFLGVVDSDFDAFKYYSSQTPNYAGPTPFQITANFNYVGGQKTVTSGIRTLTNTLSNYVDSPIKTSDLPSVYRTLAYKRSTGIGFAYFKNNGEYLGGTFRAYDQILNFSKKGRFNIGNGISGGVGYVRIRSILISGYKYVDILDEVAPVVTSNGTIEGGAPDAKTAIHDNSEATRIVLNPGQYIEIDLTNTTKDAPIHEIRITANSTAANSLSAKIATNAMGAVWSVSVALGDSAVTRSLGEKKSALFTNTIRSIFCPEIRYLLGLSETQTEGCRRIRIENNSAIQLKVYEIDVIQSTKEIAFGDDAATTDVIVDVDMTGSDVPIGSTGPTKKVNVRNTSESDTSICSVLLNSDGFYDPAIAILEYSSAPGGPWYDKLNPPPAPDGIQIGPVVPEGNMPFYIRSKLPSSGQLFQRFSAQFTVKLTNV